MQVEDTAPVNDSTRDIFAFFVFYFNDFISTAFKICICQTCGGKHMHSITDDVVEIMTDFEG